MNGPWTSRFRDAAGRFWPGRIGLLIGRQPTWGMKAAIGAAVAVLVAITLLLVVPALIVGFVVLLIAAGISRARQWLAGILPRSDGRRNVRVIVRRDNGL